MIRGLNIAGQVPTGARPKQESERGTEKRATSDFTVTFHDAILSAPSVCRPCNSRAGRAEGELSEETGECGQLGEMGGFYWSSGMSSKWHRLAKYCSLRFYDTT